MAKKIIALLILFSSICLISAPQDFSSKSSIKTFKSIQQFEQVLDSIDKINSASQREVALNDLWEQLILEHKIPLIISDSVVFLYRGKVQKVSWAGDFNGWDPGDSSYRGKQAGNSDIWFMEKSFPSDARLDYKIVADKEWILDPANPNIQYSGFGPNSELRMPHWKYPISTIPQPDINHGRISKNIIFFSRKEYLNYKIQYKVYLPYEYEKLKNLPIVYVTDGEEYSQPLQGSMVETLDNLIYNGKINPVIVVFIDPCNPDTLNQNRRMQEYRESKAFLNFVCNELIPHIDSSYRTSPNADARLIMGASLGGWTAAWFGLKRPDVFHLIGIQSPAFTDEIINSFAGSPLIPLKIFMSTGTIHDTQQRALKMKNILKEKNYVFKYIEVNEGHSWGNWRALVDDILIYFFNPVKENNN
jgi:enterochelin esterase-like enzyme